MKFLEMFSRNDRGIRIEVPHEPVVFERALSPSDTTRCALLAAIAALNALDQAHEKQMRDLVPDLGPEIDEARQALEAAFHSIEGDHNCPVKNCCSVVPGPDKSVRCHMCHIHKNQRGVQ